MGITASDYMLIKFINLHLEALNENWHFYHLISSSE